MAFKELQQQIASSETIDFGNIFNDTLELFKKVWLQGFLLFLFTVIAVIVVQVAIGLPLTLLMGGAAYFSPENFNNSSNISTIIGTILLLIFVISLILVLLTIVIGLLGGFYIIIRDIDLKEEHDTSDFFVLLKRDKFFKTFKVATAQIGLSILFMLMCYFPIIYALVPISYIVVIYAFNPELSVREIIKLAFAVGNKNWIQTFLLRIVVGFIAMFGIFLCGIGLFFTFALTLIPVYFSYKHTFGFDNRNAIDEIGYKEVF